MKKLKKIEMIKLVEENFGLNLVEKRLKEICPMKNLESLSMVKLQELIDIIEFEMKW